MTERIFNFSAGPAVIPVPVLEQAQRDMLSLPGVGMSVMEISHRSKTFEAIIQGAEAGLRELLAIPENYHVLFLQGGASLQFAMVPMNFLSLDASADYIVTGSWGKKAVKEAQKFGGVSFAANMADGGFTRVPNQDELNLDSRAAYVHLTSNETIEGVQWKTEPEAGSVPLVCDSSSDILSRPIPVDKYGIIYAGAQKNMGPSGVTLVIIRDDLLPRIREGLATMLDYRTHTKDKSLHNTPNTWGIYIIDLVCKWLKEKGGLAGMQREIALAGGAGARGVVVRGIAVEIADDEGGEGVARGTAEIVADLRRRRRRHVGDAGLCIGRRHSDGERNDDRYCAHDSSAHMSARPIRKANSHVEETFLHDRPPPHQRGAGAGVLGGAGGGSAAAKIEPRGLGDAHRRRARRQSAGERAKALRACRQPPRVLAFARLPQMRI